MRLKTMEGPLAVHNGNGDILNSPKRINTVQNSNITTNYNNTSLNYENNSSNNVTTELENTAHLNILTNIVQDKVQWCQASLQEAQNNAKNNTHRRLHLVNVNINTLAATLRHRQRQEVSPPPPPPLIKNTTAKSTSIGSICSQRSSPDDTSFLEYEEAQQSCSSADTSPQDEERGFDISDSESSEDGNLSNRGTVQRRGIVNPNYPGFQHLAHTLASDAEYTDDDLECDSPTNIERLRESLSAKFEAEANNNNNVEETETDYKIDSVNRLDSVENIQKVFYDKPAFNIDEDSEFNRNSGNCNSSGEVKVNLNIRVEERAIQIENIVGDFSEEVEAELDRVSLKNEDSYRSQKIERAVVQELEEAVEKLQIIKDLSPTAIKYNIEPNIEEPFGKLSPTKLLPLHRVLEDTEIVRKIVRPEELTLEVEFPEPLGYDPVNIVSDNEKHTTNKEEQAREAGETFEKSQKRKEVVSRVESELSSSNDLRDDLIQPKMDGTSLAEDQLRIKIKDAFLSNAKENISGSKMSENVLVDANLNFQDTKMEVDNCLKKKELNRELEELECQIKKIKSDTRVCDNESTKLRKEEFSKSYNDKVETHVKKRKDYNQQTGSLITFPRREGVTRGRENLNRRSVPIIKEKKKTNMEILGSFDVYNIETAMPKIDLEAIECHLRAAREEETKCREKMLTEVPDNDQDPLYRTLQRKLSLQDEIKTKRRTDREEIRRRLAMGSEDDYYTDRPGRKPSLQARLQSGMNLQICFMNESLSDTDSPSSDSECPMTNPKHHKSNNNSSKLPLKIEKSPQQHPARPATLSLSQQPLQMTREPLQELDFFSRQAKLQTEARMALAQAKEMARMQMEIEKQRQKKSPITEMIRTSMEKVGIPFPEDKRRLSRQILTDMNVAQLQVIVNDLHTQIENLNESLVKFLMTRDDLHMEQDSMLVDIEDLTRYLGAKEQVLKEQILPPTKNNNTPPSPAPPSPLQTFNSNLKPHLHRIANLVKK